MQHHVTSLYIKSRTTVFVNHDLVHFAVYKVVLRGKPTSSALNRFIYLKLGTKFRKKN